MVLLIDFMLIYPPSTTTDKLILQFLAEIRKFTVPVYFQFISICFGYLQYFKAVTLVEDFIIFIRN